jgi:hypothetical protein
VGLVGSDYNVLDGEMLQYHRQTWLCELAPRAETRVILEVDVDRGTLILLNQHTSAITTNDYVGRASAQRMSSRRGTADATVCREVLVSPGMQDRHRMLSGTGPIHPLEPPLRWAAQVGYGTKIRVSNPTHHAAHDGSGDAKTKERAEPLLVVPTCDSSSAAVVADPGTTGGASARDLRGDASAAPVSMKNLPLPVLALICSSLSARDLCRLACVSRRFTEPLSRQSTAANDHSGSVSVLRPVIQEGARLAALRHPTALFGRGDGGVGAIFAEDLGVGLRKGKKSVFAHPDRDEAWIRLLWRLERGASGAISSTTSI